MVDRRNRLVGFWLLLILGLASHTLASAMPIFFNLSAAVESPEAFSHGMILLMMSLFYTIPVAGILILFYAQKRGWLMAHAILASFMLLFHTLHIGDLVNNFALEQFVILPVNFILALLLTIESWRLLKSTRE